MSRNPRPSSFRIQSLGLRAASPWLRAASLGRRPGGCRQRRAGVAAELAMVLPVLCLITFGSMQVANTIHFKQALTCAAFEGTRMASGETADRDKMNLRIQAILDARRVINAQITITPGGDLRKLQPGTPVTISITAPVKGNVNGPNFVQFSKSITATGRTVH